MIAAVAFPSHFQGMSLKRESLLPPQVADAMRNDAVGFRLKLLREALDMSPSEMADMLGIERTYWSRFEKGRQGLSDSVAALLVVRFGVTLDWLILGVWGGMPLDLTEKIRSVMPEQNIQAFAGSFGARRQE